MLWWRVLGATAHTRLANWKCAVPISNLTKYMCVLLHFKRPCNSLQIVQCIMYSETQLYLHLVHGVLYYHWLHVSALCVGYLQVRIINLIVGYNRLFGLVVSFWLQTQSSRVRFPALPDFLSSSGSATGSTQPSEPREVNWGATWIKRSSGSRSRKQRLTAVGIRYADHVKPLYPQKLALRCTAAAQCGLFTHKSVPVIFEPPCILLQIVGFSLWTEKCF
jgi:hypothetical protein